MYFHSNVPFFTWFRATTSQSDLKSSRACTIKGSHVQCSSSHVLVALQINLHWGPSALCETKISRVLIRNPPLSSKISLKICMQRKNLSAEVCFYPLAFTFNGKLLCFVPKRFLSRWEGGVFLSQNPHCLHIRQQGQLGLRAWQLAHFSFPSRNLRLSCFLTQFTSWDHVSR